MYNKYDLYSKTDDIYDINSLKTYYMNLINKYSRILICLYNYHQLKGYTVLFIKFIASFITFIHFINIFI